MSKQLYDVLAADLFCGLGGTTEGLVRACRKLKKTMQLIAINHWEIAISSHRSNHKDFEHYCESIEGINPRKVVRGGYLHLLVASPECIYHSNALGGRPIKDQSRASAWCILRWAEALWIDRLIIENVKEFRKWGPLDRKNRPIKSRQGETYRAFIQALEACGYRVEERVLNAADYGDATTRERLFIQAVKGRREITWPRKTHAPRDMIKARRAPGIRHQWKPAYEIIDWRLPGKSIFNRPKPLAKNTIERIYAGLAKYSGLPFLVPNFSEAPGQQPRTHSITDPMPTATSHGAGCLVQPIGYIVNMKGESIGRAATDPLPTQTTQAHLYLAQPMFEEAVIVGAGGPEGSGRARPVSEPIKTLLAENHFGLATPYLVILRNHCDAQELTDPVPTLCGSNHVGIARPELRPVIVKSYTGSDAADIARPLPTITAGFEHLGLARAVIVPLNHGGDHRAYPTDEPMRTITSVDAWGLTSYGLKPFVLNNRGGDDGYLRSTPTDAPLGALTTHNPMGLVEPFLCDPFLIDYHGNHDGRRDGAARHSSLDEPIKTLDTSNRYGLCQPLVFKYNSNGGARPVTDPLETVTSRDRFGLLETALDLRPGDRLAYLDIRFRMLQPHELAAAHSLPRGYQIAGTREDKVKQIGNMVPRKLAQALCTAALSA